MKKLLYITILIPVFNFAQIRAKVVGIKDGDTIVVLLEDNSQKTLRLAEVDCPESGQAFGKNAKQFTSNEIFGKEILFWTTNNDRYGRTVAKVFYQNGKYISAEIIKNGFGWWYYKYSTDKNLFNLEQHAREKKLGLWATKAIAPWEWRNIKRTKSQNIYRQ